MRYIVGIDLGGTNIVAGCVAEDGSEILGVRSVPTGAEEGPGRCGPPDHRGRQRQHRGDPRAEARGRR